ncbi:MAG: hypothetical protein ACYSUP_05290 [Planctomycetota bacterium]|jgi:hypothetical protein
MPGITSKAGTKTIVVLCGLLLVGICTAPMVKAKCDEQADEQQAKQVKNEYEGSRVLVEAFVVEVKLEALYASGVNPIGQKPNSVSIENIQQCLKDPDSGRVTAGARAAAKQGGRANMEVTETIYIEREKPVRRRPGGEANIQKVFDSYEASKRFDVEVFSEADGRIRAEFVFRQYTLAKIPEDKARPPDKITWKWSGQVTLEADEPSIVGAEQDEQKATFLILCAHVDSN